MEIKKKLKNKKFFKKSAKLNSTKKELSQSDYENRTENIKHSTAIYASVDGGNLHD